MGIHCVAYYDEPGGHELVEVDYQCSAYCMGSTLESVGIMAESIAGQKDTEDGGSISWGAWPCGSETDYDVTCSGCGELLWHGLQDLAVVGV